MKKDVYIIIAAIVFGLVAYWLMAGGLDLFKKKSNEPPLVTLTGKTTYDAKTHIFYSPEGKFSVKLPAPVIQFSRLPEAAGCWTITTQTPSTAYRVSMTESKVQVQSVLDPAHWQVHTMKACQGVVNGQLRATEKKGYPFALNGGTCPGYCSEGTLPEGDPAGPIYKAECFMYLPADGRYEFHLIAAGTPEGMNSPETKEFFDSFTIVP